jgi:histidyl-tRNA synthetase
MFQPPKGTRDWLPTDMRKLNYLVSVIERVFKNYGYEPLDSPAFEDWELLSAKSAGGEELKKETYYFKDKSDRELGLRYDFTVPTARIVASDPSIPKPFKRYSIGKVWRYDQPQAGRYREFWQADVDIYGTLLPVADAEVIAVAVDCLRKLGFKDFKVRLNDRRVIERKIVNLGIKNPLEVFRCLDKLEKMGEECVIKELREKGIDTGKIEKVMKLVRSKPEEMDELESLVKELKKFGISKEIVVDFSLVRGFDYYTGAVFEISTGGLSIAGGGRYDGLVETYGGKPTPAVGISLGVSRIIDEMEKEKLFKIEDYPARVFVCAVNDDVRTDVVKITQELRNKGIPADFDTAGRNLRKQLDYINAKKIPYAIVVGPEEIKTKKLVLRDMESGKERKLTLVEVEKLLV